MFCCTGTSSEVNFCYLPYCIVLAMCCAVLQCCSVLFNWIPLFNFRFSESVENVDVEEAKR